MSQPLLSDQPPTLDRCKELVVEALWRLGVEMWSRVMNYRVEKVPEMEDSSAPRGKGSLGEAGEMTRVSSPLDVKMRVPAPEDCPDLQRRPCGLMLPRTQAGTEVVSFPLVPPSFL